MLCDVPPANTEAKRFKAGGKIAEGYNNSEVNGDERGTIGSDEKEFKGYDLFARKYLREEYRKFGLGHGYDLAGFSTYHQVRGLRWPMIDGKET